MAKAVKLLGIFLFPLVAVYSLLVWFHHKIYDWGWRKVCRVPAPVISIGNIQLGGTGKTPLTETVARLLRESGFVVAVLSRGYARQEQQLYLVDSSNRSRISPAQIGDEPYLLLQNVPDVLLGMFDYPETKQHPGFDLSLRCNFVDGTSGTTYLRLVGNEGSMNVMWDKVVLRTNEKNEPQDAFLKGKQAEAASKVPPRKKMLPPRELVYQVEEGYRGAHYDHHANFYNAIRNGKTVVEDAVFGLRAAAPALACNNSYFDSKFIKWDPKNIKLKS